MEPPSVCPHCGREIEPRVERGYIVTVGVAIKGGRYKQVPGVFDEPASLMDITRWAEIEAAHLRGTVTDMKLSRFHRRDGEPVPSSS